MTFNSVEFLIFFPIVVLIYFIIPQRVKYIWLLVSSYYFYMSWNPKYAVLIALSTVVTWLSGTLIGVIDKRYTAKHREGKRYKKWCVAGCAVMNLGILAFFKYYHFILNNITAVLGRVGIEVQIPVFDVLLPVGISFYTFQALSYTIDVYRGEMEPEKNLLKYALFVSFFPQLVAGPIERSKNLIRQIHEPHYFDGERVTRGLLLMMWGFFKKLVIADRAAILVTEVYNNYINYTGVQIAVATVVFAVQIYCDFSGYSDIAIGAAQVMGFKLMDNFDSPYFARSVSEFWRRWHISLTTWFRDYVYIPLGGNRQGKWKKYRNIMVTFGLSGLWHGASWNYIVWGFLNGCYQVIGDLTQNMRHRMQHFFKIDTGCWSYRFFQGILTFLLVDFSWVFFRATSLKTALQMIAHGIRNFAPISMLDTSKIFGINTLALDEKDFFVLIMAVILLAIVDAVKRKTNIRTWILSQNMFFRYLLYYGIIFSVLIFGIYGPEFDASTFIYFQF